MYVLRGIALWLIRHVLLPTAVGWLVFLALSPTSPYIRAINESPSVAVTQWWLTGKVILFLLGRAARPSPG